MEGLTAKVFRTYNASITMQIELNKMTDKEIKKLSVDVRHSSSILVRSPRSLCFLD